MKEIILKLSKEYLIQKNMRNIKDGEIIKTLLTTEESEYNKIAKKMKLSDFWLRNLSKMSKIKEKSLYLAEEFVSLSLNYNEEKIEKLSKELNKINKTTARATIYYLIRRLNLENIEVLFQNISNENSKYFLLDIINLLKDKYFPISLEEKILRLEEYIKELRNSLEIITFEKEQLEEKNMKEKEDNIFIAKREFFIKLNSKENNYFIDNFKLSQLKLKKLASKNYEIPLELESIIITLKSFSKFLRMNKIQEIANIGDIIDINLNESFDYNYYGSEFLDETMKKKVRIETSGWKYENIVISKPTIREVTENER